MLNCTHRDVIMSDDQHEEEVAVSVEEESEDKEDDEEDVDEEEDVSDLRGRYLPGCCQKMSCGSCETTQTLASTKSNSALSKKALRMTFDSEVSVISIRLFRVGLTLFVINLFALTFSYSSYQSEILFQSCQKDCKRKCFDSLSFKTMVELRRDFWGKKPNGNERWEKFVTAIKSARNLFSERAVNGTISGSDYSTPMIFMAGQQEMCEQAYCNMLGVATTQGYKSSLWKQAVSYCSGRKSLCDQWHYTLLAIILHV